MSKFTTKDLLNQAARLARMAVEESDSDDEAVLLNAAGKGWNAANLSMLAVIDRLTGRRPSGTETRRRVLEQLANQHPGSHLVALRGYVADVFSDLHLRAEEQAEFKVKVLRRRVREVAERLVPTAQEIIRVGVGGRGPGGRF